MPTAPVFPALSALQHLPNSDFSGRGSVELNIGIIAACLPYLRPYARIVWQVNPDTHPNQLEPRENDKPRAPTAASTHVLLPPDASAVYLRSSTVTCITGGIRKVSLSLSQERIGSADTAVDPEHGGIQKMHSYFVSTSDEIEEDDTRGRDFRKHY